MNEERCIEEKKDDTKPCPVCGEDLQAFHSSSPAHSR
jgi:hypothetical protein